MKAHKTTEAVKALSEEAYMLPKEAESRWQSTGNPWWGSSPVLIGITVILAALDAVVLFSVLDVAMTQAEWMGIAVSLCIALILNFLPLVIAGNLQKAIYKLERYALSKALLGVMAFFLLFSATVILRFAYKDMYGVETQATTLVSTVGDTYQEKEDSEVKDSTKGMATIILLSIEPLITSVLGFLLAFFNSDPLQSKIAYLRKRRLELMEAQGDLRAAISNMDCGKEQLLALDEERYRAARALVHARCDQLRAEARFLLSEHLREPSAISRLSGQGITEMMETSITEEEYQETVKKPLDLTRNELQPVGIPA